MPLFESQGWKTSISEYCPEDFIDIDDFRKLKLNFAAGDIRTWPYALTALTLPMDLSRKIIEVPPDNKFNGRVILTKTSRYNNPFLNYNELRPLQCDIVFIGLEEEHKAFCNDYFEVDFYKVKDAYETAQIIAGADCMISNQNGLYSIAEMMKTPRILCSPEFISIERNGKNYIVPGPCNNIPQRRSLHYSDDK